MSESKPAKDAVKKLQEFLEKEKISLRLSPIKVKMVDDGSAIIEAPIIIVTPSTEPKTEKGN